MLILVLKARFVFLITLEIQSNEENNKCSLMSIMMYREQVAKHYPCSLLYEYSVDRENINIQ